MPLLFITVILGCGSSEKRDQNADTAMTKISDTSVQQNIPQPPLSPDSAGARKEQEKSSIDTVKRP
jgi:hypothetical protein